jgi:amino acid adenylation domain-containing protein
MFHPGVLHAIFLFKGVLMGKQTNLTMKDIDHIMALTPMQEGMLFHHLEAPESPAYSECFHVRVLGPMEPPLFWLAWNRVIQWNEALRTSFRWETLQSPVQLVRKQYCPPQESLDLTKLPESQRRERLEEFTRAFGSRPFDLTEVPLRLALVRLSPQESCILLSYHHILLDGWSNAIVWNEFFTVYHSLLDNSPLQHPAKPLFRRYVKAVLRQDQKPRQEFWSKYLQGIEGAGELPVPTIASAEEPKPARLSLPLASETIAAWGRTSQSLKVTFATLFYCAWSLILKRFADTTDVVVGTTVSGRGLAIDGIQSMVGLCVNTVPLRVKDVEGETVNGFIKRLHADTQARRPFETTSLTAVKEYGGAPPESPLFSTIVAVENYPLYPMDGGGHNRLTIISRGVSESTHYPLALSVVEGEEPEMTIHYRSRTFDPQNIELLGRMLQTAVEALASNGQSPVSAIDFLSETQRRRLLSDLQALDSMPGNFLPIATRFLNHAGLHTHAVAIMDHRANGHLTYDCLKLRASRIAGRLKREGVGRGSITALLLERSPDMVAAILGTWLAGSAYLPISTDYPQSRIDYLLKDSNAALILTSSLVKEILGENGPGLEAGKGGNAGEAAYVMYTSGSTGRPKGVVVEHRNLGNTVDYFINRYSVGHGTRILQTSHVTFDPSIEQISTALAGGGCLCMTAESEAVEPEILAAYIATRRIHVINAVPALLREILTDRPRLESLTAVISGGDRLDRDLKDRLLELGYPLHNHYGPTETTIDALCGRCAEGDVTLGTPVAGTLALVVDVHGNVQPEGLPGELYLAGAGLARGYLNRPELTDRQFTRFMGRRMYRTGDRARVSARQHIQFLGRMDRQVKIRGHRVEPGEVSAWLRRHPAVKEGEAVARQTAAGETALCAYIVGKPGETLEADLLRDWLSDHVPEYMVPRFYIQMESLHRTSGGKIDTQRLPRPGLEEDAAVEPPQGATETALAAIWARVLDRQPEKIGRQGHFFYLGGHSLKAMALSAGIRKEFKVEFPVARVFEYPVLKEMAAAVQKGRPMTAIPIPKAEARDHYPLTPGQERLYFLQQVAPQSAAYHMTSGWRLRGAVDEAALEQAFLQLVRRYDCFRVYFDEIDGRPVQRLKHNPDFSLQIRDIDDPTDSQSFIRPFDLSTAPLMRVGLFRLPGGERYLLVDMHHIICDGVSSAVLMEELSALLAGESLPAPEIGYIDFSLWRNSEGVRTAIQKQGDFWRELFGGEISTVDLPLDVPRPLLQQFEGGVVSCSLERDRHIRLGELADRWDCTLFMTLMAAVAVFISRLCGNEEIVLGTPVAGRGHDQVARVPGFFVNTVALPIEASGDGLFSTLLKQVKGLVLEGFAHQDYPFEDVLDQLAIPRDAGRNPLVDVMFATQETQGSGLRLPAVEVESFPPGRRTAKFDLTILAIPAADRLEIEIEYAASLFKRETVQRFAGYLTRILTAVADGDDCLLRDIDMVSPREKDEILHIFNDPLRQTTDTPPVHQTIANRSRRIPDAIAVAAVENGNNAILTYGGLEAEAEELAAVLRTKGARPGAIVAIMAEPTLAMLIGVSAILKTGAAFLPLDPSLPRARVELMLRDSTAPLLVMDPAVQAPSPQGIDVVSADSRLRDGQLPAKTGTGDDPAYVIYTSGSTGVPKGVVIQHRALDNLCGWHNRQFAVTPRDHASRYAGFGFDASVWEIFPYLVAGASIYQVPAAIKTDMTPLNRFFLERDITVAFLPTQVCQQFMELDNRSLRLLLTGGDKLNAYTPHGYRLVNNYGPTENTVVSTYFPVLEAEANIPIGFPIEGTTVYVLDRWGHLQPVGIPGECCLAGAGLAMGYLNRPELTAASFTPNPRQPGLLYRSGDLVRWRADGAIEFLGRIDSQIKIRGFRIELGEIQHRLLTHPHIKEAVVLAPPLVAYVVLETGYGPEDLFGELSGFLADSLPGYMIPSCFVPIAELPLTANGKLDTRALPEPRETPAAPAEPRNRLERRLREIWAAVLGIDEESIGIDSDFFQLGGHSLNAGRLTAALGQRLGIQLPVAKVFLYPTIRRLGEFVQEEGAVEDEDWPPVPVAAHYPLSSAQTRLFVLHNVDPGSTAYNVPTILELRGEVDPAELEQAFKRLIEHHPMLRASFLSIEGEPRMRFSDSVDFQIQRLKKDPADLEELMKNFVRPFALDKPPLLRVSLAETEDPGRWLLLLDVHHIIADGGSMGILLTELTDCLDKRSLKPLSRGFLDFVYRQRRLRERGALRGREAFWRETLSGEIPVLDLPLDRPRPAVRDFSGSAYTFSFPSRWVEGLEALAARRGMTLFMVLLAIYSIWLHKLSGQEDVVVGVPVDGRRMVELKPVVGMFVNTLPLRLFPRRENTVGEFFEEVREFVLSAFDCQEVPFVDIVDLVDPVDIVGRFGRNPLFDVMFAFTDIEGLRGGDEWRLDFSDLTLAHVSAPNFTSKFDFTLYARSVPDGLCFTLEYDLNLFEPATIQRFGGYFCCVAESVLGDFGQVVGDISIISEAEREWILGEFNRSDTPFPRDVTVVDLFRERVEDCGDRVAVMDVGGCLTYGELWRRASLRADELRKEGIGAGCIVPVLLERSLELGVALWGILLAGAAYCPIDPGYPQQRIDFILKDIGGPHTPSADSFAYVIYTSGSTGRPKGTVIRHRSLVNRLLWMQDYYPLGVGDVILQKTTFTFDVSVWELFWWAITGAAVHFLAPGGEKDPAKMMEAIQRRKVTVMHFVPSMLNAFLEAVEADPGRALPRLGSLRQVFASGEALTPVQVERFAATLFKANGTRLCNLYGPTEATIDVSYYTCPLEDPPERVPIGRPIWNTTLYTVNSAGQLQPPGIPGELCIGGEGLAAGYLNNPELTARRFEGGKIYRTGDLARLLPEGEIEFLGRLDHQVKIRGFRIELPEIEGALLSHPRVTDAVVLVRQDRSGDPFLCGYVVADCRREEILEYVGQRLPYYMVPAQLMMMETMPLTHSGKVDRKGLPAPKLEAGTDDGPGTAVEEVIRRAWGAVLGLEPSGVGLDRDFFSLGGHSLKATFMIAKIYKELGVEIPLPQVFKTPTVRGLAEYLRSRDRRFVPIPLQEKKDYYPLSSAQERMFLLNRVKERDVGDNTTDVLWLEGELRIEDFQEAVNRLALRHESLRTSFFLLDEGPVQRVCDQVSVPFDIIDAQLAVNDQTGIDQLVKDFIRPFDLEKAPLLRVRLAKLELERYLLMLDIHHIVSDGTTMAILRSECFRLYNGKPLPPLTAQYKDFAVWQRQTAGSEEMAAQERYWRDKFAGGVPVLHLPTDFPRPEVQSFAGGHRNITVDGELTAAIRDLCRREGCTLYMVLSAVFNVLLARYSGDDRIVVGTPVAGRRHPDTANIAGFFINTLPLMNAPEPRKQFRDFLAEARQNTLLDFQHQDLPFDRLVRMLGLPQDRSRQKMFDVMVVAQNTGVADAAMEEAGMEGLAIRSYDFDKQATQFDLLLHAFEKDDHIDLRLDYCTALFKPATIETMLRHLLNVTMEVTANPEVLIGKIQVVEALPLLDSDIPHKDQEDLEVDFEF